MCDSRAQVVIPSVNRRLFISTTLIPSPGLITVAVVSTAVSHMCGNGTVRAISVTDTLKGTDQLL